METKSSSRSRALILIKWVALLTIAASIFITLRSMPTGDIAVSLQSWLQGLGVFGPVVLGVLYILGTLLLVPASVLTIASGALFGLWVGTLTVSIASTTGAALAFLISRYLARARVARAVQASPKLTALDKAIDDGGWRIVAMLRLSPAVPFNLQNYFYGLTSIRFWPCVLTSWLAMLPGTFLYVYIGQVSGAVVSGGRTKSPLEWVLLTVGLLATVAVTVYLTRLAQRRLAEAAPAAEPQSSESVAPAKAGPSTRSVAVLVVCAFLAVAGAMAANRSGGLGKVLTSLFGPPQKVLAETYEGQLQGSTFDHSAFDRLLHAHISEGGWVDYTGLAKELPALKAYAATLASAPFIDLGRNEKLAFLINAYNASTLQLILEHMPVRSITDIPDSERWDAVRWPIAGEVLSLNQIEHERIRPNFREPRVHFALVCAAIGCPPLRNEAYTGARLEQQLTEQSEYVHTHDRWLQFTGDASISLTKLYDWYGGDFVQVAPSILDFAAQYNDALRTAIGQDKRPTIKWLEYDWKLNDVSNRPR